MPCQPLSLLAWNLACKQDFYRNSSFQPWSWLLQDKEQPAFHDSEFPALGGALRSSNVGLPNGDRPGSLDGANLYASLGVHKGLLPSEFNIQSEEFPALPGATGREADGRQTEQQSSNPTNQVCSPLWVIDSKLVP